ncbi:MAG: GFA family protein [Actinomycetia bacterium]|nr:GFA family protein [Actinomycetes bacterium]MCP4962310.1 GFA family protein [Actinomycetes bacterium]
MTKSDGTRTGGCLCRSVRYRLVGALEPVMQCHCENCRRLSGNFVAACRVDARDMIIDDADDQMTWYDVGYAEYAFCRRCGSTLMFRAVDRRDNPSLMVGTLDDAKGLGLKSVWFADEAQEHNTLPAGVPHHDGNA